MPTANVDITNSDLELAGTIAQHNVLAQTWDAGHWTVTSCNDNTPTLGWTLHGLVSRKLGPMAYLLCLFSLLLALLALSRYSTMIDHLASSINRVAKDCSTVCHLHDSQLLSYF